MEQIPPIVRFARIVRTADSYEEFFLACMADDEMSALLDRLSCAWLSPGGRCAEPISSADLYGQLKKMCEDIENAEFVGA